MEKQKKSLVKSHPFWHHLAMVVTEEAKNFILLFAGVELIVGGWVIYNYAGQFFFKLAVGLPLVFIGISITSMKIYEILLTVIDVRRIKAICKYCSRDEGD